MEDKSEISSLRVGFDATPTSEFVSVTASLAEDGSFTLDGATLEEILGTSLDQSSHVLYLEATDIHGNIGVTAIRTGVGSAPTNETELNLAVGSVYGLDPYPDGIALPAFGQRQLSLRLMARRGRYQRCRCWDSLFCQPSRYRTSNRRWYGDGTQRRRHHHQDILRSHIGGNSRGHRSPGKWAGSCWRRWRDCRRG